MIAIRDSQAGVIGDNYGVVFLYAVLFPPSNYSSLAEVNFAAGFGRRGVPAPVPSRVPRFLPSRTIIYDYRPGCGFIVYIYRPTASFRTPFVKPDGNR